MAASSKTQLSKKNFEHIFRKHFNDLNVKVEWIEEDDTGVGVNSHFMSDILKKTFKLNTLEKPIKVIIKEPILTTFQAVISKLVKPYMKETFWYNEVIPALRPHYPEIVDLSPTCYHATSVFQDDYTQKWVDRQNMMCVMAFGRADRGILIMEDLKDPDRPGGPLKILDKTQIPQLAVAKLVLKHLAIFHGIWICWLKHQEPKTLGGLTKDQLKATFTFKVMKMKLFFKDMLNMLKAAENQSKALGKSEETIAAIRSFRKKAAMEKLVEMFGTLDTTKSKLLTMLHGDCWTSNFFVSEDLSKLTFIDFQAMTLHHPSRDIWYYIYSCTDYQWRKSHLDECLDTYASTLLPYAQKAGIDMTASDIKGEIKSNQDFGITMGMHIISLMLNPLEQSMKTNKAMKDFYKWRLAHFSQPPKENELDQLVEINKRFMEMIDEGFDLGIIG